MRGFFALALGLACVAVATGGDVALLWSEAPTSSMPWTARHSHAAVIHADGTVHSLGGYDSSITWMTQAKNDVFRLTPGSTALEQVTPLPAWSGRMAICAVVLLGTDEIVIVGGNAYGVLKNEAWRSIDKGVTFTKISDGVWAQGRAFPGCVAISATKLFAFGGESSWSPFVFHNDVRVSTDAGASWSDVDHTSCASAPMWSVRDKFGYTYMALLGRIVIAGGQESSSVYHNDIWFSENDAKCWTQAKADVNIAVDGYRGATLVTVPFRGVEALLLLGGNTWAGVYLGTVQLSLDGGFVWRVIASAALPTWSGRYRFAAIVDLVSSRLLVWGGKTGTSPYFKADLWSTSIEPVFDAILPMLRSFTVSFAVCANTQGICQVTGNQQLTVNGNNFTNAADLAISIGGGGACMEIKIINHNTLTCITPCFATWSSAHAITITSSTAPGGTFNTSAVSVAVASKYPGKAITDSVCFVSPIITSITCNNPEACSVTKSLGVATLLKVAPDELVTIKGANFGAIKPKLNTDIASLEINFGTTQCFQTVTFWNATSITLQMCAKASNTNLPIHITLGNKTSPPFTTLVKVKAAVKCDPGRIFFFLLRQFSPRLH